MAVVTHERQECLFLIRADEVQPIRGRNGKFTPEQNLCK